LLRWQHSDLGLILPDEFIPLAIQSHLIRPLSRHVLYLACRQLAEWNRQGLELRVSINLSVHDIQDLQLPESLAGLMQQFRIAPGQLTLEITENSLMTDFDRAYAVIEQLHVMGVRLAIDDFGTGYSSLSYLKRIPADELKVDKSFVTDMTQDENDAVIVRSTIELGHNMGHLVVAEGVENREVCDLLEILRCDLAQGYYICEPLDAPGLSRWLSQADWSCEALVQPG
jgi:EAL domain-containing protein (putative c-di-GMP-specific phosphodiesterase class I)